MHDTLNAFDWGGGVKKIRFSNVQANNKANETNSNK